MGSEEWRRVAGWEQYYEVSSHGRVRSLARRRWQGRGWYITKPVLRKCPKDAYGYHCVALQAGERKENRKVHHLVAEAFVGPRPEGNECRHLDGCRTNNHVSNLAWGTSAENSADAKRHGTTPVGEDNPNCKYSDEQCQRARDLYQPGVFGYDRVARAIGASRHWVRDVVLGIRRRAAK